MTLIGIVTGLPNEAALLPDDDSLIVVCDGPGPDRARRAAERAVADGAEALLSFGLAGGLDPALPPGHLVVANAVIGEDGTRAATDDAWRDRLVAEIGPEGVSVAALAAAAGPVVSVAEKRRLAAATGAVAVDMESLPVAAVARAAGIPFLAVRAVADPAGRAIPPSALAGLRPDGSTDVPAIVRALAARPKEVVGIVRLAGDYRRAEHRLRNVARALLNGAGAGGDPAD